jgi:signal transduction histidine kinase
LSKRRRIAVLLLSIIAIVSLFGTASYFEFQRFESSNSELLTNDLVTLQSFIDNTVIQRIRQMDGLSAYIKYVQTTDKEVLDDFMSQLFNLDDVILKNVAVIRGSVIEYQYPLEGNESSIGVDLTTIDAQRGSILKAMETLEPTINGPVNLVQGGKGLIVRMPISLEEGTPDKYWGLISLVMDYEQLIARVVPQELLDKYEIKIELVVNGGVVDELVYSTSDLINAEAVREVQVLGNFWRLSIERIDPNNIPFAIYWLAILGLIMSVVVTWLLNKWMSYHEILNGEVAERTRELKETNEVLEEYVAEFEEKQAELTIVNQQLEDSIDELEATQEQLILTEKLAALGDLVASLAHEINTPLGVCVTLYSFIEGNINNLSKGLSNSSHEELVEDIEQFVTENNEALSLMGLNLKRSSELVASFKMVTMDQYLDEYRIINLKEYVDEIINSIRPKYKKIDQMLSITIDPTIRLYTYPGAISQIITNLITNSVVHGFDGRQTGEMEMVAKYSDKEHVRIHYHDNGKGLTPEVKEKIFTPFFTTKKNRGSTGLGMHILYNAVVQTLEGRVNLLDAQVGFSIQIDIPTTITESHST